MIKNIKKSPILIISIFLLTLLISLVIINYLVSEDNNSEVKKFLEEIETQGNLDIVTTNVNEKERIYIHKSDQKLLDQFLIDKGYSSIPDNVEIYYTSPLPADPGVPPEIIESQIGD